MAEIVGGGQAWWFPIDSKDHVQVTDEVVSYEVDGELRLAQSFGFSSIEFGSEQEIDEPGQGERRG